MESSHLREVIEAKIGRATSKDGREWDYWCPECKKRGGHIGHLHVNYTKGCAICHSCDIGFRDLLNLVRYLYGSIPSNLLAARLKGELIEHLEGMFYQWEQDTSKAEKVKLPEEFIPFNGKPRDSRGRMIRRYLASRDVDDRMLEDLGAGYCIEGRLNGYAVFPVYVGGRLVTWTSRATPGIVMNGPKAYHAPNSESRMSLFGYDVAALMGAKRVFIGEGPFDALAFQRRADPLDAGVGLLGKVLHEEQIRLLDELPCDELCVCLDDTEHKRTVECAGRLSRKTSKRISYILIPEGDGDPHENRERLPKLIRRRTPYDPVMSDLSQLLQ